MLPLTRRHWAGACISLASSCASAFAQAPTPQFRVATFYEVRPERAADFLAATKVYADLVRAAGSDRHMSLWTSLTGPKEYVLVLYLQKLSELDTAQDPKLKGQESRATALTTRIMNCVTTYRREITTLDTDLSLPLPVSGPQSLARVLRTTVKAEHVEAYRALYKAERLPAARKSGNKLFSG